jgi:hypothetical protein
LTQAIPLRIDLAGTTFELTADDLRVLPLLERLWQPFLVGPHTTDGPIPVRFVTRDQPAPFFQIDEEEPTHCSDLWVAMFAARLQMVQRAIGRAQDHRTYLHSAVLERNGAGTLLIGPYDSGKTTFSIALLERGWRLLSDDVALIDRGTLAIEWFPKPLGIKRGQWADYERFWDPRPDWIPRPSGAFLLPATAFALGRKVESVEAIALLKFEEGSRPRVEELSPARAVVLAAECSGGAGLDSLRTLAALSERVGNIFRLTHGGGDEAIAELLRMLGRG